jgi:hypothetical protein
MRAHVRHAPSPRRRALGIAAGLLTAAACACLPASALAAGAPSPLFHLSAITALALPAQSATRFEVVASGVSAANAPSYTWTLTLTGPAGARPCDDQLVSGGTRLAAGTYRWVSQGPSFVWYHGAVGSYPADRAYGCSAAQIGRDGYPGTVSVVAENGMAYCRAELTAAVRQGGATVSGPAASCGAGGYTLLPGLVPVPAALLAQTRSLDAQFAALVGAVRGGRLIGLASFDRAVAAIRARQRAGYAALYPPIWGCRFAPLLGDAVSAATLVDGQVASVDAGLSVTGSAIAADATALQALSAEVGSCADRSAAARKAASTLRTLAAEASSGGAAALPGLARTLTTVLSHDLPAVYGISFATLVSREIGENAALDRARSALQARSSGEALSALQGALGSERALGVALVREARHVGAVAYAHS